MIYEIRDVREVAAAEVADWFAAADAHRRAKAAGIADPIGQKCSLCADHLARKLLAKAAGCAEREIVFARTDLGKPYAPHLPWHFSLSHSGPFVACAVHQATVGLDLQQPRPVDAALARRVCSPEELAWCMPEGQLDATRFFTLWTRKEALVKLEGSTLLRAPRRRSVLDLRPLYLESLKTEDYILSIIYE